MDNLKDQVRQMLANTLAVANERLGAAIEQGPGATAEEIGELINALDSIRLVVLITSTGECGNPDCPVHGAASRAAQDPNN